MKSLKQLGVILIILTITFISWVDLIYAEGSLSINGIESVESKGNNHVKRIMLKE